MTKLEHDRREQARLDIEGACAILDGLPDLGGVLATTDPELRRRVYEAFRLSARSTETPARYD